MQPIEGPELTLPRNHSSCRRVVLFFSRFLYFLEVTGPCGIDGSSVNITRRRPVNVEGETFATFFWGEYLSHALFREIAHGGDVVVVSGVLFCSPYCTYKLLALDSPPGYYTLPPRGTLSFLCHAEEPTLERLLRDMILLYCILEPRGFVCFSGP